MLNGWSDLAVVFGRPPVFATIGISAIVLGACDNPTFTHDDPNAAAKLEVVAIDEIAKHPELQQVAMTLGAKIYAAACAKCHGGDLKGIPAQHTSNLTASSGATHLKYGSGPQSIQDTVTSGRHPDGPAFKDKLTLGEIKAVSVYVSSFATRVAP